MSRAWRKFHEAATRLLVRNDCNLAASFRPASKVDIKPERLVDFSIVDELEQSGFIDSVYKG